MHDKQKKYFGSYRNERDAAKRYDEISILIKGLEVTHLITNSSIGQDQFRLHETRGASSPPFRR